MFNALVTLLPQILCPYGYSDVSESSWLAAGSSIYMHKGIYWLSSESSVIIVVDCLAVLEQKARIFVMWFVFCFSLYSARLWPVGSFDDILWSSGGHCGWAYHRLHQAVQGCLYHIHRLCCSRSCLVHAGNERVLYSCVFSSYGRPRGMHTHTCTCASVKNPSNWTLKSPHRSVIVHCPVISLC